MNEINLAKARVCQSLMNRVEYFDKLIDESDYQKDQEKISKLFTQQTYLLYRLERVVSR